MIKAFRVSLVLVIALQFGCKEHKNSLDNNTVVKDTIQEKEMQIKFKTFSSEAIKDLNEFPEFKPLKSSLDSLNYVTPESSYEQISTLYVRAKDFEELLPKKLRSNPIIARIKVLVTELGLLDQKINKKEPTVALLNTSKKAIAIAYDNLVYQINEHYLEIPSNIAKELLQESKDLSDSIPLP